MRTQLLLLFHYASQIGVETVSDIQRESQAVLDSIKENSFHGASELWKKTTVSLHTFPRRLF
jgi:hypothetical protein